MLTGLSTARLNRSCPPLLCVRAACLAALAFVSGAARTAEPVMSPPPGSELQLFIENDFLSGTDRYYTNGIKFGIGASGTPLGELLKLPADGLLGRITSFDGSVPHFGLFLGQNMYTPRDITIAAPQPNDRPWAAWLYLGGVAQVAHGDKLHTVEVDVGVTGPAALGDPVQSNWHKLFGFEQPKGWVTQAPSEPAFMVSYLQKRRYGSANGIQVVPHAGVTVGTVLTLARAGGIVRIGSNMTGFGQDTIEPGGAMLQNTRTRKPCPDWQPCEWFAFIGVDYRAVAYNTFLDGPVFHDGPSVNRHTGVHDFTAGVSMRLGVLRLSLTRVLRSEEFRTALGGGGRQSFHSLNIGAEF